MFFFIVHASVCCPPAGPFTRTVATEINLTNTTDQVVAFKVKTIQPERYVVKPTKGIINANQNAVVTVLLQPLETEAQVERFINSKQKFMVQWVTGESVSQSVAEMVCFIIILYAHYIIHSINSLIITRVR